MEVIHWLHYIDAYEGYIATFGVVASLLFTAHTVRSDTQTRRIGNLLQITSNHREIWMEFLNNPKLSRIKSVTPDLIKQPINDAEHIFVNEVILHVNTAFYANRNHLVTEYDESLRRDIADFFKLPIPKSVWQTSKHFQNVAFVKFMEGILQ